MTFLSKTAILGKASCGCVVAIDFEDTAKGRRAYLEKGYQIEIVSRETALEVIKMVNYPCQHLINPHFVN